MKLKTYDVTIQATVTKTIRVKSESEQQAKEDAHSEFTTQCDGYDENYDEETLSCELVMPEGK